MAKRTKITTDITADLKSVDKHQKAMKALNPYKFTDPGQTRWVRRPPKSVTKGKPSTMEKIADKFGYVRLPW